MAGGPLKIWTIKTPTRAALRAQGNARGRTRAGDGVGPPPGVVRLTTSTDRSTRAQAACPAHALWGAYLFGPLMWVKATPAARPRAWLADLLAVPAAAAWFTYGHEWSDGARLVAGVALALWLATVWARSIAGARSPVIGRSRGRIFGHPVVVALLGLLVPGLGLMLARARRQAAFAFWLLGPLAASTLVLAHARNAWPAGASRSALELVLAAAGAGVLVSAFAWLVQALEGARRMRPPRALGGADFASLALVVAATLFVVTFRPVAIARQMHTLGAALQADGYRLIPLALCDAAATLDPAAPEYAVDGARLAEQLGFVDLARSRRDAIESQAREWERAAGPTQPAVRVEPTPESGSGTQREMW